MPGVVWVAMVAALGGLLVTSTLPLIVPFNDWFAPENTLPRAGTTILRWFFLFVIIVLSGLIRHFLRHAAPPEDRPPGVTTKL